MGRAFNFVLRVVALHAIAASQLVAGQTCRCKDLTGSYVVTRLWNITDPNTTATDVLDAFQEGFAPDVTTFAGFQQYVGAYTNIDDTVFFYNVFETEAEAATAQAAAVTFVNGGTLNGKIAPYVFTEDEMLYWFSSANCVTESIEGNHLATQLWNVNITGSSFSTVADVADAAAEGFKDNEQGGFLDGFIEYGISLVADEDQVFVFGVFVTEDEAVAANAGALAYVSSTGLADAVGADVFTVGEIRFAYACSSAHGTAAVFSLSSLALVMAVALLSGGCHL